MNARGNWAVFDIGGDGEGDEDKFGSASRGKRIWGRFRLANQKAVAEMLIFVAFLQHKSSHFEGREISFQV